MIGILDPVARASGFLFDKLNTFWILLVAIFTFGHGVVDQLERPVDVPATVVGYKVTDIYTKVGGYLKSVNGEIGDKVTEGQELAVLDVPEL